MTHPLPSLPHPTPPVHFLMHVTVSPLSVCPAELKTTAVSLALYYIINRLKKAPRPV